METGTKSVDFEKKRPRGTEISRERETSQQPQIGVERVGISHGIYRTFACIGRTQVETLLDAGATTDLIGTDEAQDLFEVEVEPYRGTLETADGREMKAKGCIVSPPV